MITRKASHTFPTGQVLEVCQGDLTEEMLDAIVNPANSHLSHGGGVAGAIVRKGGSVIQVESDAWVKKYGPVTHAKPAYTSPGRLGCRYVIHAVGPMWGEGNEDAKLEDAVLGSLHLAERLNLNSIAFPAISTGIFGFPKDRAALIIYDSIAEYFTENKQSKVTRVRLTIIDEPTLKVFQEVFRSWIEKNQTPENPGQAAGNI
jgi:O-acetyl-ADP-ribose deacetylase